MLCCSDTPAARQSADAGQKAAGAGSDRPDEPSRDHRSLLSGAGPISTSTGLFPCSELVTKRQSLATKRSYLELLVGLPDRLAIRLLPPVVAVFAEEPDDLAVEQEQSSTCIAAAGAQPRTAAKGVPDLTDTSRVMSPAGQSSGVPL